MTAALPPELARRPNAVMRPRDAQGVYAHPGPEFARLARAGVLRRLAYGYYVRVPAAESGRPSWRPDLHAVALGIAQSDAGQDGAALMHVSAARVHGVLPREIALAVVAVDSQRPSLSVGSGRIRFMKRMVDVLDLQRVVLPLVEGWVTTREQTLLDLVVHPSIEGLDVEVAREALAQLALEVDWSRVTHLAVTQRRAGALAQARRRLEG